MGLLLDPPPNTPSLIWSKLKDWLYKLWKAVQGQTFGADTGSYSAAIMSTSAPGDGVGVYGAGGVYVGPSIVLAASNSNGQTLTNGVAATVTNWTTEIDAANAFNASTGIYTIPAAGVYEVKAQALLNQITWVANGAWIVRIYKTGTNVSSGGVWMTAAGTAYGFGTCSYTGQFIPGDTVSVQVANASGNNSTLYSFGPADARTYNRLQIFKVA